MAEADLYTIVKVARNEDLTEQIGRDRYFDLVDHNKVRSFRIKRWTPFNLFKEEVAKEFGIPVQFQRFWLWAKRKNNTYRPHWHVTPQLEARPVGRLRAPEANDAELNLFLEVERSRQGLPKIPPTVCSDDILLFFKLYDPLKEELSYVGRLYVKASGMPVEILAKINGLAGFAPDEDIQLFEEIKFEPSVMCEPVDKMVTFRGSQLQDGDIVCFQKSPQVESSGQCGHPDVPSFLKYVHHHQIKPEHHSKYWCRICSEPKPIERGQGTDSGGSTLQTRSANISDGKVRFLAYWVSSEASLLLERIHSTYKDTFTKFSMKGQKLPTVLLESFASFVESMSTTKVNEVQEDVLKQATLSIEDFEQVGLELSWLKKRLEEAKKANKQAESLVYVDLCETALKVGRAKVRELEEGLVRAKAELEDCSTDLPNSLAVNDYLLLDVV
ncbi:ubiquitin C-terminal hydrolase 12-like isoform X3 [Rhododendron vialii]|uniref:ubiquitin C-terminal hydrolase 12-like isoform X3 n=1 Tax=Rhododendron vialii TaxID=182163 RepID=UPI002660477C|nr:ubiquitin C-terminal hydrolase 12-like isoform X3 [Rhododendron vialii]XP_058215002.1 ubiquitin C-terminal hydrolase 12-like isoform X3 [Rhododendron vialii]